MKTVLCLFILTAGCAGNSEQQGSPQECAGAGGSATGGTGGKPGDVVSDRRGVGWFTVQTDIPLIPREHVGTPSGTVVTLSSPVMNESSPDPATIAMDAYSSWVGCFNFRFGTIRNQVLWYDEPDHNGLFTLACDPSREDLLFYRDLRLSSKYSFKANETYDEQSTSYIVTSHINQTFRIQILENSADKTLLRFSYERIQ